MPTTLTQANILALFTAKATAELGGLGATYSNSNLPLHGTPDISAHKNVSDFDNNTAEPTFTVSDLGGGMIGETAINNVFYLMHHMAMKLTVIRSLQLYYTYGEYTISTSSEGRAKLKSGLELYFPIPAVPAVGSVVDGTVINTFLTSLMAAVKDRRTNAAYAHPLVAEEHIPSCHCSCHTSCHGSRGRR